MLDPQLLEKADGGLRAEALQRAAGKAGIFSPVAGKLGVYVCEIAASVACNPVFFTYRGFFSMVTCAPALAAQTAAAMPEAPPPTTMTFFFVFICAALNTQLFLIVLLPVYHIDLAGVRYRMPERVHRQFCANGFELQRSRQNDRVLTPPRIRVPKKQSMRLPPLTDDGKRCNMISISF